MTRIQWRPQMRRPLLILIALCTAWTVLGAQPVLTPEPAAADSNQDAA